MEAAPHERQREGEKHRSRAVILLLLLSLSVVACLAMWRESGLPVAAQTVNELPADVGVLYLDAFYLWQKRTPEALRRSEQMLIEVASRAPRFGGAPADLATVFTI